MSSLGIIDKSYLLSLFDKRRVAQLVDDGDGPQSNRIDDAIAAAETEVFNLLSRQYTLQNLKDDASIKRVCAITAMYMLEMRRADITQAINTAYGQSLLYLQRIVEGDAKLNAVEEVLPRLTQTNAEDVFEHSGYFIGMPSIDDKP
jgi:phage gp36-like protein